MAKPKKKSQGFGQSQVRTRGAKDFIVAFGKKEGDEQEVFLIANLEKLDEFLLGALPLVFQPLFVMGFVKRTVFRGYLGCSLWAFLLRGRSCHLAILRRLSEEISDLHQVVAHSPSYLSHSG